MTVVLITGALTGIGRATALAFAREGDQIVVSGRHGEAGEENTILFLACKAPFLTGQSIVVDGVKTAA